MVSEEPLPIYSWELSIMKWKYPLSDIDLGKEEDNFGDADMPLAIAPRTDEVLLLQMDGHLTYEEFEKAFDLAHKGCLEVSEIQKKALLDKYQTIAEEVQEEVQ